MYSSSQNDYLYSSVNFKELDQENNKAHVKKQTLVILVRVNDDNTLVSGIG